jgi:hypothetical protein
MAVEEEPTPKDIDVPPTYTFTRNGLTTVTFPGQTIRIAMATELIDAIIEFERSTEKHLLELYNNRTAEGLDANPFQFDYLNRSQRSLREEVAASLDYFSENPAEGEAIQQLLEDWLVAQVNEVFPEVKNTAVPGRAGVLPDGLFPRYVNAHGVEYKEWVRNSLTGALMVDQALNKYLSVAHLDLGTSREDNDKLVLITGNNFTNMEREWDEAYGYIYGLSGNIADPNQNIGDDDMFLNHYVGEVNRDPDFVGMADTIFNAFKRGRAAIVARRYDIRDRQIDILRKEISKVIAINAVHFLEQGKLAINPENPNYGSAFHYLSKAYGAVFSLRFTRDPITNGPYFSRVEVDSFLTDMLNDGDHGFWEVKVATLTAISEAIADRFGFSVEEAKNR